MRKQRQKMKQKQSMYYSYRDCVDEEIGLEQR